MANSLSMWFYLGGIAGIYGLIFIEKLDPSFVLALLLPWPSPFEFGTSFRHDTWNIIDVFQEFVCF
jgi:hypothetical protein